jgi:Isopentenyldiphosphate isomerase
MMTEEWVDIVDENNIVIGTAPRSKMRQQKLLHRASYIVITNALGQLYVQRRTASKDYCPSMLDACCGGVVSAGEDILASAYRELDEEMGIHDVPLRSYGSFLHCDHECKVWGALFSCQYDGELALQAEEVEYVMLMTPVEILHRTEEFTPDSLAAIKLWLSAS